MRAQYNSTYDSDCSFKNKLLYKNAYIRSVKLRTHFSSSHVCARIVVLHSLMDNKT